MGCIDQFNHNRYISVINNEGLGPFWIFFTIKSTRKNNYGCFTLLSCCVVYLLL